MIPIRPVTPVRDINKDIEQNVEILTKPREILLIY